ncbi:MAG: serpin family protein, partial [Myxococcales bacterium]
AGQAQGGAGNAGQAQGGAGTGGATPFEQKRSDKPRADGSAVSEADRKAVVDGNAAFAFDLYGKLRQDSGNAGKNLFFSPLSVTLALGMTEAGALGATQTEIDQAMHFTLPPASLHPALNWLALELNKRPQQAIDYAKNNMAANVPDVALRTVNAVWGEKTLDWQDGYLDVLAESYGAGINLGNFKQTPEAERLVINQWVADQTEQRIKDLIPGKAIDEQTRFVLVNAINLTFAWQEDFDKAKTTTGPFTVEGGAATTASLMTRPLQTGYAEDDLAESVVLPLFSKSLSVVVYLPKAGKFAEFESKVATEVPALQAAEQFATIDLTLPRFTFTTDTIPLEKILQDQGMKTAFSSQANFTPMTTT